MRIGIISGIFAAAFAVALAVPAMAACVSTDHPVDNLQWGTAEHFSGGFARLLMQGIAADTSQPIEWTNPPAADDLYALIVGNQVLMIRVRGRMMCPDGPIDRDRFDKARRRALPWDT